MTNKKAIDLLDNLIGMVDDNHDSDYDTALKMAIKALEQNKRDWIPCSKRMPEKFNTYLVTLMGIRELEGMDNEIAMAEYFGNDLWEYSDVSYPDDKKVIAWWQLPKPYKPQKERGKK